MAENKRSKINVSLIVTLLSVVSVAIFGWLYQNFQSVPLHICFLIAQTCLISIVIWQACDPFADAAQFVGTQLRIPSSVRGATLDAVASSMPELFTGIFFVLVAVSGLSSANDEILREASGEGFGATVATCAGSAVYNMIFIPAMCAIFISFVRKSRPTIDVEDKVISRDGIWFLGCEFVLIFFLSQDRMYWWMAFVFIALYVTYVWFLYRDARQYQKYMGMIKKRIKDGETPEKAIDSLRSQGLKISRDLVERINRDESDDGEDEAGILFGLLKVKLTTTRAWLVIALATAVAAAACYWLVRVTNAIAEDFNIPVFFVAVIITAAASSVPDTFLSMGSARRGDDDGAVSNAFGSNIFDITICLSLPLLVGSYLSGWQPIELTTEGTPNPGLVYLRILLCTFSVITLLIMWHNRQLTRNKAYLLFAMYAVFVGYAVWGSITS